MCLQYHVLGTGFCHVLRLRSDHCDALSGLAMPFQGLIDQERVQGFLQEASHETAEHKTCEAALLNKKRKREAGEGEALGDGTSKQADKQLLGFQIMQIQIAWKWILQSSRVATQSQFPSSSSSSSSRQ